MAANWIEDSAELADTAADALGGVAIAEVIDNLDGTNLGRVQIRLPWLPGIEPWARVAAGSAGSGRGMYFIPQVGEEVLVAFQHRDVRDPYILGTLWNGKDRPPADSPLDPKMKRIIRTPAGHLVEFDDLEKTITIKTSSGQTVELTPQEITVATTSEMGKITLDMTGSISVTAKQKIELSAPAITLDGEIVEIKGSASTKLGGGAVCEIQASLVKVN